MIISHKYKFIFIKTSKTAGSSIELYLSKYCGKNDIIIPMANEKIEWDYARNWKGFIFKHLIISLFIDFFKTFTCKKNIMASAIKRFLSLKFYFIYAKMAIRNIMKIKKIYNTLKKIYNTLNWSYITLIDRYSHITAEHLKKRVSKKIWNDYFVFCIERNTYDKLVSHYFWDKACLKKENFDFVYFLSDNYRTTRTNYNSYTNGSGKVIVDKILRYENLDEELKQVFHQLGIPYDDWKKSKKLKTTQRPDKKEYKKYYTKEQKEYVAKKYANEIKLMGYKF